MQPTYTLEELLVRISFADNEDSVKALLLLFEEERECYDKEQLTQAYNRLLGRIQYLYSKGRLRY